AAPPRPPARQQEDDIMIEVSKGSFYAVIGKLDVNPHVVGAFDKVTGYTQEWITPNRAVLGKTVGQCAHGLKPKKYFVTEEFFTKNSAALTRIA
ncbi:hypothetical protein, partial [Azospirillum sp. TSA6c]|uniref:hypothetical protein n=1 Tax=Azospirillum sp. TSA6c TaxID=709813 RepID=UPI001B3C0CDF